MLTDTEIKLKGIEALINALGEVQAEKFISCPNAQFPIYSL